MGDPRVEGLVTHGIRGLQDRSQRMKGVRWLFELILLQPYGQVREGVRGRPRSGACLRRALAELAAMVLAEKQRDAALSRVIKQIALAPKSEGTAVPARRRARGSG